MNMIVFGVWNFDYVWVLPTYVVCVIVGVELAVSQLGIGNSVVLVV